MRSLRRSRAAVGMAACSLILTMLGPYWTSAANAEVSKQHLEQIIAELGATPERNPLGEVWLWP